MTPRSTLRYAAAWTPVFVAYALIALVQYGPEGVFPVGLCALVNIGVAALLGVGVWHLARRFPWPDGTARRPAFVAVHAAAAVAFTVLWIPGSWAIRSVVVSEPGGDLLHSFLWWEALGGVFFYLAIASTGYAVCALRVAREGEDARLAAVTSLSRAEADLARAEADRTAAELAALRAHLHPHFLFNTLHALGALVRSSPPDAGRAVEAFGDLFRYTLRNDREGRALVPLAEEVAFARTYLDIEAIRLGDRLRVCWDVDDDALDALVPPLLVQPLVENAVRHGIAPRKQGGTVSIHAHVSIVGATEALHVEVHDDGDGGPVHLDGAGYGIRGVRRTLDHLYGDDAGLDVWSRPGEGFHVRLHLPYAVVLTERALAPAAHRSAAPPVP